MPPLDARAERVLNPFLAGRPHARDKEEYTATEARAGGDGAFFVRSLGRRAIPFGNGRGTDKWRQLALLNVW